ncbi:NfeD family protein [Defluviitalea raffinosedens]|uniref:NfeD family protein n=2 Tax=Defluviitalea raffinosedens TaxID=1450156 RepID=A0A7C8HDK4_9FIRM|nr:NfeD family protein [Defluviitalea raffinosedens]MBM7686622.1 membrane protein implicated in regulation of membrane protease activity [Defluviitalea raffinosedens]HHW67895.1 NfeD family protein [Candidatus Epulonipiscium sp.]
MELMWLIWLILAIGFAIIEMANTSFFMIWFSAGAIGALIASLLTSNFIIQFSVFLIISTILLILTHKITKNFITSKPSYKTNIDALKNAQGVVIEEINNSKGTGQVKVQGEIWSALSANDEIIAVNTKIIVFEVKGVKLIVSPDVTLN